MRCCRNVHARSYLPTTTATTLKTVVSHHIPADVGSYKPAKVISVVDDEAVVGGLWDAGAESAAGPDESNVACCMPVLAVDPGAASARIT